MKTIQDKLYNFTGVKTEIGSYVFKEGIYGVREDKKYTVIDVKISYDDNGTMVETRTLLEHNDKGGL